MDVQVKCMVVDAKSFVEEEFPHYNKDQKAVIVGNLINALVGFESRKTLHDIDARLSSISDSLRHLSDIEYAIKQLGE